MGRWQLAICAYPVIHLDWGQYTGTFNFQSAQLVIESKYPYIDLQFRCILVYAQKIYLDYEKFVPP